MTRRPPAGYVKIGRLGRSFKLAGGVRLHLDNAYLLDSYRDEYPTQVTDDTPDRDALEALGRLYVTGLGDTRLRAHEIVSGSLIAYLEGVRDRTVARSLVNAEVWAELTDLPDELLADLTAPSPEEELVGLAVTVDGIRVGRVSAAHVGSANEYVEVDLDAGGAVLLPLVAPYVTVTSASVALIDPPPGLFDA